MFTRITRGMIRYSLPDGGGGSGGSAGGSGGAGGSGAGSGEGGGAGAPGGEGGPGEGSGEGSGGEGEGGEGKPTFVAPKSQEEFDRMISSRLKRAETDAAAKAAQDTKDKIAADAAAAEAVKNGDYKKLYETAEEKRIAAEAEVAKSKREGTIAKLAAKHNLPDALVDRVKGETDAEIEADIKSLAKHTAGRKAPNTEGGEGSGGAGGGTQKAPAVAFRSGPIEKWPGTQ